MKAALRLIWISFFTLFFCGAILMTLQVISRDPYPVELKHSWAKKSHWTIVRLAECPKPGSFEFSLKSIETGSILWLDLYYENEESKWKVFCSAEPIQTLRHRNFGPAFELKAALALAQKQNLDVLLNVHARANNHLDVLLQTLEPFENSQQLGMISPVRSVISEMRKSRPQWIFGADQPSLVKAHAFHSLKLLGLIDLWPDFYLVSATESTLGEELKRRGKIVLVESQIQKLMLSDEDKATAVAP